METKAAKFAIVLTVVILVKSDRVKAAIILVFILICKINANLLTYYNKVWVSFITKIIFLIYYSNNIISAKYFFVCRLLFLTNLLITSSLNIRNSNELKINIHICIIVYICFNFKISSIELRIEIRILHCDYDLIILKFINTLLYIIFT